MRKISNGLIIYAGHGRTLSSGHDSDVSFLDFVHRSEAFLGPFLQFLTRFLHLIDELRVMHVLEQPYILSSPFRHPFCTISFSSAVC